MLSINLFIQRMTLKDIQPQIVDALDGILEEIRSDEVKSARVYVPSQGRPLSRNPQRYQRQHVPKADKETLKIDI